MHCVQYALCLWLFLLGCHAQGGPISMAGGITLYWEGCLYGITWGYKESLRLNGPQNCATVCTAKGFSYVGLSHSFVCWCASSLAGSRRGIGCEALIKRCPSDPIKYACGWHDQKSVWRIDRDVCGNGVKTGAEQCDDGNVRAGDGCSTTCTVESGWRCLFASCIPVCGDSQLRGSETCDDGNLVSGDGCNNPSCTVEAGWECATPGRPCIDINECTRFGCPGAVCADSTSNAAIGKNLRTCTCPAGYDAKQNIGQPRFTLTGNAAFTGCQDINECDRYKCVDAVTRVATTCLDSTTSSGYPINERKCTCPSGYYAIGAGSKSFIDLTGANAFGGCRPICGDGRIVLGENCDDGNAASNDGCSSTCQMETGWVCTTVGSACTPVCGDGLLKGREGCDDRNKISGDGCSDACVVEPRYACPTPGSPCVRIPSNCGNGAIEKPEEDCDDRNGTPNDGCSAACAIEAGWRCFGEPSTCNEICRDSRVVGRETCDDGNDRTGDGCTASCVLEEGWVCPTPGSPCLPICGDGIKLALEDCDDKNRNDNDGCSALCKVETGWACPTPGKECVDIDECKEYGCLDNTFSNPNNNPVSPPTCRESASTSLRVPYDQRECNCTMGTHVKGLNNTNSVVLKGNTRFDGCQDINECTLYGCKDILSNQPTECFESASVPVPSVILLEDRMCRCPEGHVAVQSTSRGVTLVKSQRFDGCKSVCGDGIVVAGEACDDNNTKSGDGCSANCTEYERGFVCPPKGGPCKAICGDSKISGTETCDDGNLMSGDGCSFECRLEERYVCETPGQKCCLQVEEWLESSGGFFLKCWNGWWVTNQSAVTADLVFPFSALHFRQPIFFCGNLKISQNFTVAANTSITVAGSMELRSALHFPHNSQNEHGSINFVRPCGLPTYQQEWNNQFVMDSGGSLVLEDFNWEESSEKTSLENPYLTAQTCISTDNGNFYMHATSIIPGTFLLATYNNSCTTDSKSPVFSSSEADLPGNCPVVTHGYTSHQDRQATQATLQQGCPSAVGIGLGVTLPLLALIALAAIGVRIGLGSYTYCMEKEVEDYVMLD